MITREFNLYLHAGHSIPLVINVNQYDRGESWVFTLFNSDGTQYVPSSGAIVGIKSDNLGIINTATVDSQGRVVVAETQQMTAAVGKAVFELVIDDGTHGTANFVVLVEPKPGDNADLSESDISMIEEAVEAAANIKPYGSPLVASTVAGMTDHDKVYVYVGSETGYTSGNWYYWDGDSWESGGVYNSVAVQTDTTLTLSGVAADAKKTGDEISDLKSEINAIIAGGMGLKDTVKQALMAVLRKCLTDGDNSDLLDALYSALYDVAVLSISATFDPGNKLIYDFMSLEDIEPYVTVTANYDNGTSGTVTGWELSGTLEEGTSVITVTYMDKTTTFSVNVLAPVDVTPDMSTALPANSSGTVTWDSVAETLRVKLNSNATYWAAKVSFAFETGYTYRVTADAVVTAGTQRIGFRNVSDNKMGPASSAKTESGHIDFSGIISNSANITASPCNLSFFCAWSTSVKGDVTYSNIKVIKYLEESV